MKEKRVVIKTIDQWRSWLAKNHSKEERVFLVSYKKHTGKPSISHREAMEEAICYGWIDTIVKKLDEEKYMRGFVKRKKGANWSDNTRSYARRLIKEGRMKPIGLRIYKEGLKRKTHDHGIPKNPDTPEDLRKKLEKDKDILERYEGLTKSYKRMCLRWILSGKREETRQKRIELFLESLNSGKKIF